jgi:glycosyltransferase involved in cell wall biosynthesis
MRIGIFVDVARDAQLRGVGYHVQSLVTALSAIDRTNEYLLYYPRDLSGPDSRPWPLPDGGNFRRRPVRFPANWVNDRPRAWWQYYLPWVLRFDRVDVFHGPNHFVPAPGGPPSVVTIHDVAYFKMELYSKEMTAALRHWTRLGLDWADRVIAISKNTWADLEALGVPASKMRLIYGGGNITPEHEIAFARTDELKRLFKLPERYIVFVGTLGLRKNLQFLLRSYAALKREQPDLPQKLVLVGKPFTGFDELKALMRELAIEDDVIVTGYVDAWQIPLFYKMADVFVLPTLYEGFTLTTIEAMAYGTPVIATDTSSIREGTGDAALLVPVDDVPALTAAIRDVLGNATVRGRLVTAGLAQAAKFTWAKSAAETLDLYREAASLRGRRKEG